MLETYGREFEVKNDTLAERGFQTPLDSTLNLLNEPFRQVKIYDPISSETTYLGALKHPFIGTHLADLLELVAPEKGIGGKGGIYADYEEAQKGLEKLAKNPGKNKHSEGRDVYLHRLHSQTPLIAGVYNEFMKNHVESFMRALTFSDWDYDNLCGALKRTTFINSEEFFNGFREKAIWYIRNGIRYWRHGDEPFTTIYEEGYEENNRGYGLDRGSLVKDAFSIPKNKFRNFIDERTEVLSKRNIVSKIFSENPFYDLEEEEQNNLLADFLEDLSKEAWRQFAIKYSTSYENILVDLERREIFRQGGFWEWSFYKALKLNFTNENRVNISWGKKAEFEIIPGEEVAPGKYEPRVVNYKLIPKNNSKDGLYAMIAIKQDKDGNRRFLSQEEVSWYKGLLAVDYPERLDVVLGRVFLGYLSPDVIVNWPKEMSIGTKTQRMRGAQVPVLAGLPEQEVELLSDENPAINLLLA